MSNTSNIRVKLDSVKVTDGQGVGEGDFELNIQVLEVIGGFSSQDNIVKVIWPSQGGTEKVNNNGTVKPIGREIETYTVGSVREFKHFRILVNEEDTGTLGQDEEGQDVVDFELTKDMPRTTRSSLITLRNQGRNEGQVKVTLVAERVA